MNLEKTAFENAIFEYREEQKNLVGFFVAGICKLGAILKKYKDPLIAEKKWMRFCDEIGMSVCNANAQIRFYEFSIQNKYAELLGMTIDNWGKMLSFLSLNEEQRYSFLEKQQLEGTVDLTTGEFKELVDEIKTEKLIVVDQKPEEIKKVIYDESPSIAGLQNNTVDYSKMPTEFLTDALQKEMNLPKEFKPLLEGMIDIEKGIAKIVVPESCKTVEKKIIKAMLLASKNRIDQLLEDL